MLVSLHIVLILLSLSPSWAFSIGLLSSGFPIIEISGNENYMKRAIPRMEGIGSLQDPIHGVKMGIVSDICDNAKDNLEIDWDGSPVNHTCYHPKYRLPVLKDLKSTEECTMPVKYPKHICMNEKIEYDTLLPTFGNHRPLWPVYGEYEFVPPQRWLHNLEHGAVVMLYHPCAESLEVERLRVLVKNCIRKHVISASTSLQTDKPLALLAWGCKLEMSYVDEDIVKKFIKERAMHGPEATLAKQGQYRYKLLELAVVPKGSTYEDTNLCPEN